MKRILLASSLLLIFLFTEFCVYVPSTSPVFYDKTAGHQIVAILPYEMILTGKKPKKLTVEQIRKIEEIESISFQQSLYEVLTREYNRYRRPIRIDIQDVVTTNRILEENGVGIRESWDMSSEELARILHVDAVVRTRVEKRRYMSGLTSFSVELGSAILSALLNDDSPFIFGIALPTNKIKAGCYLHNGRDGALLWSFNITDETDWRLPANAIIEHINAQFADQFPYR